MVNQNKIYQSQNNENISVEVLYNEEDFWLTQKSMSKLFNVAENNITYHLQNIFKTGELEQDSVTQKIRVTASDGKKYNTNFYSLDVMYRADDLLKIICFYAIIHSV